MKRRLVILGIGFVLVAILGYFVARSAVPEPVPKAASAKPVSSHPVAMEDIKAPKFRRAERPPVSDRDHEAMAAGALPNQRVLLFKDKDAMARFLAKLGSGVDLLGRLDALNALRVGFGNYDDLAALLDGDEEESLVFPVNAPAPPEGTVQPGAMALGPRLLDWLGVSGDNSQWGQGVTVAVLDTGVTAQNAFSTSIQSINLVPLSSDPAAQNGHGTAVASLIIGNDSLTPGVAPKTNILDIRIANDAGQSDSFLLAQGLVAAIDAGARIINISMGSLGDSAVVRNAIAYAKQYGAVIVAASGNNGLNQVSYPAANEGVIAVGAVDALGDHLDFSNSGQSIAIAAPGLGVNAAWTQGQAVGFTGTSASAPIVAGAIAAVMTQAGNRNLTPAQAWNLLSAYLNDGGAAGSDSKLGGGMPDIGRVLNAGTRGIYDAAVASSRIIPANGGNPYGQVEVLVQNRGTETLVNTSVEVTAGGRTVLRNITALAPNAVTTVQVPISNPPSAGNSSFNVVSRVRTSGGVNDVKPSNDRRSETYVAAGAK